jgi:protein subunit release factor A
MPHGRNLDRGMSEVPADYVLPETDEALLTECDVQVFKATGPGGQGVNTTDSAVRLIHRPTGLVVVGRRERSQLRNKLDCLKRLRKRVELAQRHKAPRVATKPSRSAKARRMADKSQLAAKKSARRKPAAED